jgi:AmmeMemoRadiSam system protein A
MDEFLSWEERSILLKIARLAVYSAAHGQPLPDLCLETLPAKLHEVRASFVTLTKRGDLRGCIGAIEAYQPLACDVQEHAADAALHDFRFYPVQPDELPEISLEISCLTAARSLDYDCSDDLCRLLRPGIDGVVLRYGTHRATFLPQVWGKLPNPVSFLSHLCLKMGAPGDLWCYKKLEVFTYQVEEFHE